MEHAVALFLWNGSYVHHLYLFLYLTEVTFPVCIQDIAEKRTGMQAQAWFLLTIIYGSVERVTPTQICTCASGRVYLVKLIPSNSAHSGSLLKGHIGKPLALIMLYSCPYLLSCRLITIHSLMSTWACARSPLSGLTYVSVCTRTRAGVRARRTRILPTVMNHFHCNGFGAPQSPPPPPHSLFMRKSIAQAPPFIAAHPSCGVLHVREPCQRNGIEFCAVQIKWDWTEWGMDSLLYELLVEIKDLVWNLMSIYLLFVTPNNQTLVKCWISCYC